MRKIITCRYCDGTGEDPFDLLSPLSGCLVCNGTKQVEIEEPAIECVFCGGTGKNPLGARVPCIVCRGKGMNFCDSTTVCQLCNGTGKWSDGLPCTRCKGIGMSD